MIIYKATSPNGKVYIGLTTKTLQQRKQKHKNNYKTSKLKFHNALKKYGFDSFSWEEIYKTDNKEDLCKMEQHFISIYESNQTGYNQSNGGEGNFGFIPVNKKSIINNDGTIFNSLTEAAEYHKLSVSAISIHIKNKTVSRDGNSFCCLLDNENFTGYKKKKIIKPNYHYPNGKNDILRKKILDSNGIIYKSITHAGLESGVSRKQITRLLKSKKCTKNGVYFNYV